jgi:ATP-dependent DNA helicase RecG
MSPASNAGAAPVSIDKLSQPLQYIKGVGPVRAGLLKRLQLETLHDLLLHFPHEHRDRASVTPIRHAAIGSTINIVAQIVDVKGRRFNGKEKIDAKLQDDSGEMMAGWWNPWVAEKLTPNAWGFFSGKITQYGNKKELSGADFEILTEAEPDDDIPGGSRVATGASFGRIVPVYNLRPKQKLESGEDAPEIRINQNFLRKLVFQTLETGAALTFPDALPQDVRDAARLMPLSEAIRQIHFPDSFEKAAEARRRLVFEELFIVALGVALRRAQIDRAGAAPQLPLAPAILKRIEARLPFKLTDAQMGAFREAARDMGLTRPMNRLLQGDVGCGKTAVAVAVLLLGVAHGAQTALLAPTEVLAEQHGRTLSTLLENSRVKIGVLRGATTDAQRCTFAEELARGEISIAIGTHALLEEGVQFRNLGVVVVDEQHKFGVAQRMALRKKGRAPHVLVMTATPIPRTLTLSLYGDLDVSRIEQPPPGRGTITTKWLKEVDRPKLYATIVKEAQKGHATYVVLPRIEEGGAETKLWSEVRGAEAEFKRLKEHLPTLRVELLHGRMKSAEKDAVLANLRAGRVDVLVSTQVIEVGIDLPTATIMVIENGERFGLSSLHQLRGRVGRSERKSYCFVFADDNQENAKERIKAFVKTRDGFELAEVDFALRGPGQFFGTAQSGLPELKIADLLRDTEILAEARDFARELVHDDPRLEKKEHAALKSRVREVLGGKLGLIDVG